MKKSVLIFILIYATSVFGQIKVNLDGTPIKSIKLDSLIFMEINKYRLTVNKPSLKIFDTTELRKTSYRLTDRNTILSNSNFDHTRDPDLRFKGYSSECIFMFEKYSIGNPLTDTELTDSELEFLAKTTVQAWIDSPNHNYIISANYIKRVAITSTVTIKDNRLRLIVSYHDISGF